MSIGLRLTRSWVEWCASVCAVLGLTAAGCTFDTAPLQARERAMRGCPAGAACAGASGSGGASAATAGRAAVTEAPPIQPPITTCSAALGALASSCDQVCCGAADGCCPRDCDSKSDPDCSASCGDGVVQTGETCEPSNRAALCRKSCDDGDRCTTDVMIGSPDNCNVRCENERITTPTDADGCCPAGATASTDNDCPAGPACGDGVVADDEECDGGSNCTSGCRLRFQGGLTHRYSFSGRDNVAVDSIAAANGALIGARQDGENLLLDGARAHVTLPRGLVSRMRSATIEVWLTWHGGSGGQRLFEFSNTGGDPMRDEGRAFWNLSPDNGNKQVEVEMNFTRSFDPANTYMVYAPALSPEIRHHVAVSFDGPSRTMRLYLEGKLAGMRAEINGALAQINDENAWIGLSQFENDTGMHGAVHEFRVYDSALSDTQIAHSYQLGPDPEQAGP